MHNTNHYIGRHKTDLDTPALLIDLDKMEANIQKMASYFDTVNANLRPHVKTHKTPIIAHKQIAAGAIGVTCAKLGEAEAVVHAGIRDVLIANQIVGTQKIARLVNLAKHSEIMVAVDDVQNVQELSEAASAKGVTIRILIEINIGMNRCGVEPRDPVLKLAQQVNKCPKLKFEGLMAYEGHLVTQNGKYYRKNATLTAMVSLFNTADLLINNGIEVSILSGGGTGTYDITGSIPEITEVQAGSYVFMDANYRGVQGVGDKFDCALTVLSTVVSRPTQDRIIVDTGKKVLTEEFGIPQPIDYPELEMEYLSEEHGIMQVSDQAPNQVFNRNSNAEISLKPGEKLEILPTHCCTTVNLHDKYYGIRDEIVESVWYITARGRSQ